MEKKKVWCSAHTPTKEQLVELKDFVFLKDINPGLFNRMIQSPSDPAELMELAFHLIRWAQENQITCLVQPAGSPAFLFALGGMREDYLQVLFAHSERVSVDTPQEDGSVLKTSVFKHIRWIEM